MAKRLGNQVYVLCTHTDPLGALVGAPQLMAFRTLTDLFVYLCLVHRVKRGKCSLYDERAHGDRVGSLQRPLVDLEYAPDSLALLTCAYGGIVLTFLRPRDLKAVREHLREEKN